MPLARINFITGPTQCQDGITNNCTQECTRDADTGVHNCSCYSDLGYQINPDNDTLCIGIIKIAIYAKDTIQTMFN